MSPKPGLKRRKVAIHWQLKSNSTHYARRILFIVDLLFARRYLCILASWVSEHLRAHGVFEMGEKRPEIGRMTGWEIHEEDGERPNRDRGTPESHYKIMAPRPFRSRQSLIPSRTTFILLRICQIYTSFIFHSLQVNSPVVKLSPLPVFWCDVCIWGHRGH